MLEEYFRKNREMYEWAKANNKKVLQRIILEKMEKTRKNFNLKQEPTQLSLFDEETDQRH